jgi:phage major head subunit gpT-like protein
MAVVSSDFLIGVLTQFRSLFAREFSAAQALQGWQQFAMFQDSDGEQTTYEWFGTVPQMQDVSHDQVSLRGLDEYNFSIANREYQAAIEVSRMALERDRLNLILPRIAQLSGEAARHPGQLIFELVEDNPDAYDGTAFFADTRVIGESANIDNDLSGAWTDSVAEFQNALAAAREAMRLFQDDRGRPMNLLPNAIMVPPALEQLAWQALNVNQAGNQDRNVVPSTTTGVLSGAGYAVIVNPYLSDADDFYTFHLGGPAMRPFVWQVEKRPVLESDTDPMTRENILKRNFLYSVYGRYNVGVTDPRLAVKLTDQ